MPDFYTVAEAATLTGIARPTLRSYTPRYARYLSAEATPEQGVERSFTEADLRTLRFVFTITSSGKTHEQAMQALDAGALADFDWRPPDSAPQQAAEPPVEHLVPASRLQAAELIVRDAQQREQQALERLTAAQEELQRLRQELGHAQGQLDGYKAAQQASQYKAPAWWRSLFGGR